jgi:hypothetical protein
LTRRCWNGVELEVQMLDPHQGDVVTDDGGTAQALYTRPMPGGGYVRVELVVSDRGDVASERRRGRVVIEPRQAAPRRDDAVPLVVEELEGDDENSVVAELFRIANDNAAIARRVLRRRAEVRRAD